MKERKRMKVRKIIRVVLTCPYCGEGIWSEPGGDTSEEQYKEYVEHEKDFNEDEVMCSCCGEMMRYPAKYPFKA